MSITHEQIVECFASDDLIGIGMEADALRRKLHPETVATYVADIACCWESPQVEHLIAEADELGITGLRLQLPSDPQLPAVEALLASTGRVRPSLDLHGLTATDILTLSHQATRPVEETLRRLQAAGLQSLSGADDGILDDTVPPSLRSCSASDWLALHRTAHNLGLPSTAHMIFGTGETPAQRANHLVALDRLQQETGGFVSFKPSVAPRARADEATAVEYLKTLAISRMALDTIPHLEADWPAQGLKVLQMALRFGANDAGTLFHGDTVGIARSDGTTEEDLRRTIRGANLRPVQRDTLHHTCFLG